MNKNSILFLLTILLSSCLEKNTTDPVKAYKYWAGEKPGKDVQVIKAQYWESSHWTKEYEMYMELKTSPLWRSEFIRQNSLKRDTVYTLPDDTPSWFKPGPSDRIWQPSGFSQGSVYFEDSLSGRLLIYEIQL